MATVAIVEESKESFSHATPDNTPNRTTALQRLLILVLVAVGLAGGLAYWLHARHYESTDDAQIDGHFAQLSTRITGTVTYVNPLVENDRYVPAGTLLLELDPRDYEAALEHAKANLGTEEAELHAAQLQIPITDTAAYSQLRLAHAGRQEF